MTSTQLYNFSNSKVRPLADLLLSAAETSRVLLEYWYAHPELSTEVNADVNAVIHDGAETDGRVVIQAIDLLNLISRASELSIDYYANAQGGNAKANTVLRVAVNGKSIY